MRYLYTRCYVIAVMLSLSLSLLAASAYFTVSIRLSLSVPVLFCSVLFCMHMMRDTIWGNELTKRSAHSISRCDPETRAQHCVASCFKYTNQRVRTPGGGFTALAL